ncbi:MAG TPA: hypothetical protein EYO31_09340, partial [Phycisphaerales bacterium]|nr:hypothetical protein [Phycisphaerales bacterium]
MNDPTQHKHPSALAYYQARQTTGPKSNAGYPKNRAAHVAFITESVVTSKHVPLRHEFGDITLPDHVLMADTYGNNLVTFTRHNQSTKNTTMIEAFGINTEPVRDRQVHTILTREIMPPDQQIERITYRETVFPREQNTYLKKVRQREKFIVDFWDPIRADRTLYNVSNSMGSHSVGIDKSTIPTQSMWVLDGRIDPFATGASLMPSSRNAEGELLNRYSLNHGGTPANLTGAVNYNRNGTQFSPAKIVYSVPWEAGTQAGKDPFYYPSYEAYAEDIKRYGKAYTVIPEFKISDYMDYYILQKGKDFTAPLPGQGYLNLTGAVLNAATPPDAIASRSMPGFFKVYSTTDFLSHFKPIV